MILQRSFFIIVITLFTQGAFVTGVNATEINSKKAYPEVVFETSMGSYTLELYPEKAPKTVANFLVYVDEVFYKNTLFHRVIPKFVIQGGGFEKGMNKKSTHAPVENESNNGLKNIRASISMARSRDPDSATSQFFINVVHNPSLDHRGNKPGYTVFGKVTEGMDVVDKIIKSPTKRSGRFQDVPKEDVVVLSAKRKDSMAKNVNDKVDVSVQNQQQFIAGEHYIVLDEPVATRDNSKIEVIEMFSYGCPHCYEFEPLLMQWSERQGGDVDFWFFPAVWNKPMKLYARAFYAAYQLNVAGKIHLPLYKEIVIEHKSISNENDFADFFAKFGVDKKAFIEAFNSATVIKQAEQAEQWVRIYNPSGVPEIIVNGKYRIDRMRAGGLTEMLAVADYLINKERASLLK